MHFADHLVLEGKRRDKREGSLVQIALQGRRGHIMECFSAVLQHFSTELPDNFCFTNKDVWGCGYAMRCCVCCVKHWKLCEEVSRVAVSCVSCVSCIQFRVFRQMFTGEICGEMYSYKL